MAVLLPNASLTVHVFDHSPRWEQDAHGVPVAPATLVPLETRGPYPGNVREQADGSWTMRLDPRVDPVREHDVVTDERGRKWVLRLQPRLHQLTGYPDADYIGAVADLDPPEVL